MVLLAPGQLGEAGYVAGQVLDEWPIDLGDLRLGRVDEFGGQWNVTAFSGHGSAPSASEVTQREAGHGAWVGGRWWAAKPYTIDIAYEGETAEDRWNAEQRLLGVTGVEADIAMVTYEETARRTDVVINGEVSIDPVNAYAFTAQVPLLAPDPFRYAMDPDMVASTGLPSQVGGLVWATTITPEVVNLVTNPSAGLAPSGWGGTASVTQDSTRAHSGTKSFLISGGASAFKTWFVAPPNTTYTLSAWVWIPSSETGNIRVRAGSTGFVTNNDSPIITARDQWVRASVTATTDADGGNVALYPGINLTGQMWADDLMITLGSTLYDYFDGDQPGCAWDGTPHASTSRLLSVITGGATWPATWDAAVASGALSVENVGNDTAYPLFRVFGPLPDFTLALPTGESLAVDLGADGGQLAEGEWIEVDMKRQRVMLLGQSSRRRALRGSFFGLPPGKSSVMFGSSVQNQTAFAEIEGRSTWR